MKLRTPGKFGHTFANSGNPDETALYEPSHQDFHCLLVFIPIIIIGIKQGPVRIYLMSEVT